MRYELIRCAFRWLWRNDDEVLNAFVPGPVKRDTNNWAPRVGFAYSPQFKSGLARAVCSATESTSIRGGFGVSYDQLFYSLLALTAQLSENGCTEPDGINGAGSGPIPGPAAEGDDADAVSQGRHSSTSLRIPRIQLRTTGVFQSRGRSVTNYSVEIGYNGNRSHHLFRQSQNNPGVLTQAMADAVIAGCTSSNLSTCQNPAPSRLIPSWGSRQSLEATGNSAYDGMYVQVNARTAFGLRLGANYTWSANFSDSEEFSNDGAASGDGGLSGSSAASRRIS